MNLHFCVIAIIFVTLANEALSVDVHYEACKPRTCGNEVNISFPFWLSDCQESLCGYPGFNVTCKGEDSVLSMSDDDYIIKDILYSNHSFVLANAAAYDEQCPLPLHNFSLDQTLFNYSWLHVNLTFFYNCTEEPEDYITYPIHCASNSSHYSFATFHKEAMERMNYSLDSCLSWVTLPVDEAADMNALFKMNYTEILKTGFSLNWTPQNCRNCEGSGGRCGVNGNEFVCFCSDRPHVKTCDDGSFVL